MAHTAYCATVEATSGHRLINQVGTLQFLATTSKTARITVGFSRLVAGLVAPNMALAGTKTNLVGNMTPAIVGQITQQLDRVVIVSRATATTKGNYSYSLYGY